MVCWLLFFIPESQELTNQKIVNELSNSIDLESTLVRAESLFHRFQRTVEAIDKKSSFPKPSLRHRTTPSSSSIPTTNPASSNTESTIGASSGTDMQTNAPIEGATKDKGKGSGNGNSRGDGELEDMPERPKVISKELRGLLSRKVVVLPRKVVRREGEGLAKVQK